MSVIFFKSEAVLRLLFSHITRIFGDPCCEHPESKEVWQYMGTYDGWHQFRHRDLPADVAARVNVPPGKTYCDFRTKDIRRMSEVEQAIAECIAAIAANAANINVACDRIAKMPRVTAMFAAAQVMAGVSGPRWQATRARFLYLDL